MLLNESSFQFLEYFSAKFIIYQDKIRTYVQTMLTLFAFRKDSNVYACTGMNAWTKWMPNFRCNTKMYPGKNIFPGILFLIYLCIYSVNIRKYSKVTHRHFNTIEVKEISMNLYFATWEIRWSYNTPFESLNRLLFCANPIMY